MRLGAVTFRTIERSMIDSWERAALEKTPATSRDEVSSYFNRERTRMQGTAAAVVEIVAERQRVLELARDRADIAVALLRFFSPANWTPRLQSFCVPLGFQHTDTHIEMIFESKATVPESCQSAAYRKWDAWVIREQDVARMPGVLERLNALVDTTSKTPYMKDLLEGLILYSRNLIAADPSDKLLYVLVALESVLLRNENEPIQKSIAERMAFLVGDELERRKVIVSTVLKTYAVRSRFVHHGQSVEDLDALEAVMLDAWACFIGLLNRIDRVSTREQLIRELEDRKLA